MPVIRVFVMGLTSMLNDIVQTVVVDRPDLTLAGTSDHADFAAAAAAHPDVVVAPLDRLSPEAIGPFLSTHCRVRLLGIATDARVAAVYEMRPHRTALTDLGTDMLADVLAGRR
jgi:hypothetical protein